MPHDLFTEDFKEQPFWWDRTPRPEFEPGSLPSRADLAIIGSGYTGLSAAIEATRGGLDTLVLDAEAAGWGCSARNGGQISTSLKPSFGDLARRYGAGRALSILMEGHRALDWLASFVEAEGIDCDFQRCGRFLGAHTLAWFDRLRRDLENEHRELRTDSFPVTRDEQHGEIGSDYYYGGIVSPHHASVDPARLHMGLLDLAIRSGGKIATNCAVSGLERLSDGFRVSTAQGDVTAKRVILATSGYSGRLSPWHRRRIIPIGSYMLATQPLPDRLIGELNPKGRVNSDTRKLVVYYRTCPRRQRVLFGGRVSIKEPSARATAPALHDEMVRIYPQLADVRISHAWMGFVGYTFDKLPHLGERDGLYHSMGYCGSGVSLACYCGMRIAQQVLGLPEGRTPLDTTRFETRPYYFGKPWFLAPSVRYYRWADRRGR